MEMTLAEYREATRKIRLALDRLEGQGHATTREEIVRWLREAIAVLEGEP